MRGLTTPKFPFTSISLFLTFTSVTKETQDVVALICISLSDSEVEHFWLNI